MTVLSLFQQSRRWNKGHLKSGKGPSKAYCLLGALAHVYAQKDPSNYYFSSYRKARIRAEKAYQKLFPSRGATGRVSLAFFNDHQDTTIEDIRKVCRLARI